MHACAVWCVLSTPVDKHLASLSLSLCSIEERDTKGVVWSQLADYDRTSLHNSGIRKGEEVREKGGEREREREREREKMAVTYSVLMLNPTSRVAL